MISVPGLIIRKKDFRNLEYIASLYNCEIEIIDNTEKSEQQELVEEIQEEADGKSHKSNVDTKQRTEN